VSARPSAPPDLASGLEAIAAGELGEERLEVYARLRSEAPVHWSDTLGAWVLARYPDVRAALEDRRLRPITEGPGASVFGGGFFHWDGREHGKKSGILTRRIRSPRGLRELRPAIDAIARRVAGELPFREEVDLRERFTIQVPLLVISELTAIDDAPRLRGWYDAIMAGGTSSIGNPAARAAGLEAMESLRAYLRPLLAERRERPGRDVVSDYVNATYDGAPLPGEEIVAVVGQLLPAGVETTERVLTSALRELALAPALWDEVRQGREDEALLASFGAEALRLFPPIQAANRVVRAPLDLAGVRLEPGDRVVSVIASANRDGERFAEPDRFDPRRFLPRPDRQFTAAGDILPFGAGEHHCAGSRLAGAEMVSALRAILDRAGRIELLDDAPPVGRLVLFSPPSLCARLLPA